jgi:hypothetical protein
MAFDSNAIAPGRTYAVDTHDGLDSARQPIPFALLVTKKAKGAQKYSSTKVYHRIVGEYNGRKIPNPVTLQTFKRWVVRELEGYDLFALTGEA